MPKTTKQISLFLTNKQGTLNEFLNVLKEKNINILALNISETEKYGIVRLIVENPDEVLDYLKQKDYLASITKIFIVPVSNEVGGLHGLIKKIAQEGIAVEYMYSMSYIEKTDLAYMCIAVDDNNKMENCIEKYSIKVESIN